MGAFLDKPKLDKHNENGHGNGLRYGLASMQGWRMEMEDTHCAVTRMPGDLSGWSFFAVFDGHAGARISELCAQQLLSVIISTKEFLRIDPELVPSIDEIRDGIRCGFLQLDEQMRQIPEVESGLDKSGSTAVCAIVSPEHIYMANCGDSRGLLLRQGKVFFGTQDHKPANPTEKERIQSAGGNVIIQRVNGSLAVSRALGDYDYKKVEGKGPTEQLVSPEPEVSVFTRVPEDDFIVLACDGIWDVMSNDELAEYLLDRVAVKHDLSVICNEIVDVSLHKGSRDNMSIIVVAFENAPTVDPVRQKADERLDEAIREEIVKYCARKDPRRIEEDVISYLDSEIPVSFPNFQGFPLGGIVTKRSFIERELRKVVDEFNQITNDNNQRNNVDGDDDVIRAVSTPKIKRENEEDSSRLQ